MTMPNTIRTMILHPKNTPIRPSSYQKRSSSFIDKDFQIKYSTLVIAAAVVSICVSALPIYYFLHQNYEIFYKLAYDYAPNLIEHLKMELAWMRVLLVGSIIGIVTFFTFISLKMTSKIVAPIKLMSHHLQYLSRGLWNQKTIKVRDDDEFQNFVELYNYFFLSFQAQAKHELELLKNIDLSHLDKQSYLTIKNLIDTKTHQLGVEASSSPALASEPTPDQQHAS